MRPTPRDWTTTENAAELDRFVDLVSRIHVETTQYKLGVQAMEWAGRRARQGKGGCLMVGGRSGSGKSWLLQRHLTASTFPPLDDPLIDPLPVITVETPSPGRMKSFAGRLLASVVGGPVSTHPSEAALLDRFVQIGLKRGLRVIKVEEWQHVVNGFDTQTNGRNRIREKEASENVKSIINSTPFQWIFAGEPPIMQFFHDFEQLEGRGRKLPMMPFAWPEDSEEYADFLQEYDTQLAALLGNRSGLREMVPRFMLATGGYYAQAVRRILIDAAESAFMAGHTDVTVTLGITYERWKWCGDAANPFLMDESQVRARLDEIHGEPAKPRSCDGTIGARGTGMPTEPTFGK